jgi:hypothetical protein
VLSVTVVNPCHKSIVDETTLHQPLSVKSSKIAFFQGDQCDASLVSIFSVRSDNDLNSKVLSSIPRREKKI